MLDGIAERLAAITRPIGEVLDLGSFAGEFRPPVAARIARLDAGYAFARASGGVQGDEDRLPFADGAFDAVVSAGVLDQVDDLPGALTLVRRVLRPDGVFLGAFAGAGSLPTLRACLLEAEADRPAARLHPQVDVRAAGDLLVRAGLTLPVADVEGLSVRYASLDRLIGDLRGMAATSLLPRPAPMSRAAFARAAAAFAARAELDGRTTEQFRIVYLTGWAPAPGQPRPARPGSATASLSDALKRR